MCLCLNNSPSLQQSGLKHVMNPRGRRCCPTYGRKTEMENMKEKERASCCSQTDNFSDSVRQQLTSTLLFLLEGWAHSALLAQIFLALAFGRETSSKSDGATQASNCKRTAVGWRGRMRARSHEATGDWKKRLWVLVIESCRICLWQTASYTRKKILKCSIIFSIKLLLKWSNTYEARCCHLIKKKYSKWIAHFLIYMRK